MTENVYVNDITTSRRIEMNVMRAKEIKDDPVMKEVKYNDKFVYIDAVDDETQRATVFYTNKSEEPFEVPVQDLVEID